MLDKTRKIIYIITGTLTIISLVFMLMHKVGLCASSDSSVQGFYPLSFPLPINGEYFGSHFEITDDVITEILSVSSNSRNDCIAMHEESIAQNYIQVQVFQFDQGFTVYDHPEDIMQASFRYNVAQTCLVEYSFTTGEATLLTVYGSGWSAAMLPYQVFSALPNSEYYLPFNSYCFLYPVWASSGSLSYDGVTYFSNWSISSGGHPLGGGSGEITTLPNLEDLTGTPQTGDTQDDLFSLLKGWLSTINGNIKKGFTNIYDNISSFLQPYMERFKAVTDIIENPEDFLFCSQERQQELLEGSQVYQDIQSLQGIGNNIFGVLGATASQHVYWTFDFSGTVLDNCGVVQIDFDWYDSIRNYVVPLFLAFFYVGMLLLIIRKIPGIISGASSNSDDK